MADVRSASACDQTVRQTPWYVMLLLLPPASGVFTIGDEPIPANGDVCPCGDKRPDDGPKYAEEGRGRPNGSSL